jgi:hypothetical protein
MHGRHVLAALALGSAVLLAAPPTETARAQGNLARLPATEIPVAITTGAGGTPAISPGEIRLATGKYYRFVVTSDGKAVWRLELTELLENSHVRLVTISGIEVQMQSLVFRAIEFDEAGKAAFTLTPIRPGTYSLDVGHDPRSQGRPIGEPGVGQGAATAHARVIVQ